jgi:hypothetical protein
MIQKSVFDSQQGANDFSLLQSFQTSSGPHQRLTQWILEALSPWVKRPGSEADSLVVRLKVVELYPYSPTCLYGVVFN